MRMQCEPRMRNDCETRSLGVGYERGDGQTKRSWPCMTAEFQESITTRLLDRGGRRFRKVVWQFRRGHLLLYPGKKLQHTRQHAVRGYNVV